MIIEEAFKNVKGHFFEGIINVTNTFLNCFFSNKMAVE